LNNLFFDFDPYRNQNGLVPYTNPPGGTTQNDICFTAYYLAAVLDNQDLPEEEKQRLKTAVEKHIDPDGRTRRKPGDNELESNDNLCGWGFLSLHLDRSWAKRILSYFRSNGWYWGDSHDQRSWLGRHRALEAHFQVVAGEKPDFFTQAFWVLATLYSCTRPKSDQDNFSLSFLMVRTVQDAVKMKFAPPGLMIGASLVWNLVWKLREMTLKQNLSNYGWANSPHVKWLKS